jgi:hypothetical protein
LSTDQNLPPTVCSQCDKLLPDYLKFHITCVSSYSQLKEIKQCIKEEVIEDEEAKDEELQTIQVMPIYVELLKNEEEPEEINDLKKETLNDEDDGDSAFSPKPQDLSDDSDVNKEKTKKTKKVEEVIVEPPVKKAKRPRKPQQCPVCGTVVQRLESECHLLIQ